MDEIRRKGEDYRFTAYWQKGGRSIDMYLHGGAVLEGQFHEHAVVQLHVNHVERARRADETAARAQPVLGVRGWGMMLRRIRTAVTATHHLDTKPRPLLPLVGEFGPGRRTGMTTWRRDKRPGLSDRER